MNIHHLELFYFVAKHGGIAAAVRNIPYGIQQPAVSGQIAKLEESLGTKLFQRRPFALSPTGTELFEFIRPFFENIDVVAERLRQNSSPQLRIAAPAIVLHDYLPEILRRVRAKFPAFRLYLHEATRADAERLLLALDVAQRLRHRLTVAVTGFFLGEQICFRHALDPVKLYSFESLSIERICSRNSGLFSCP